MATEVQERKVQLVAPVMGDVERDAAVIALRAMLRRGELVERDADLIRGAVEAMRTAPPFQPQTVAAAGLDGALDGAGLEEAAKNRLGGFARDSATSRAAALQNYPRSGTQRMDVLHRVAQAAHGATRDELVTWLGKPPNVVTPRVKELVQGGWLEAKLDDKGQLVTRKTRAQSDAEVLVITERTRVEMRRRGARLAR